MQDCGTGLYGRISILIYEIYANYYLNEMKGLEMMCAKLCSPSFTGHHTVGEGAMFVQILAHTSRTKHP